MAGPLIVGAAALAAAGAGLALFSGYTARRVEKALPPQGRFVDVEGVRLHYVEAGSEGPVLLLIHGLGGQIGNFAHSLIDPLAERYRVIAVDRPGSGWSARPRNASAALSEQARVLAAFVEALRLERPVVVGHSLGGALALQLALDRPDIPAALALISPLTAPEDTPPEPFGALAIRSGAVRDLVAWTLAAPMGMLRRDQVLGYLFDPDPVPADFATRGGGLLGLRPEAFRNASLDMLAAEAGMPALAERYGDLDLPVGVLFGRDDRVLAAEKHGAALDGKIKGVEIEVVEGGHMIPLTAPEACVRLIDRVVERSRSAAAA